MPLTAALLFDPLLFDPSARNTRGSFSSEAFVVVPGIGDQAPDFQLIDSTGAQRSLGSLVANGPCVLIFYRGHW